MVRLCSIISLWSVFVSARAFASGLLVRTPLIVESPSPPDAFEEAEESDFGPLKFRLYVPYGSVDGYSESLPHYSVMIVEYLGEWIAVRPIIDVLSPGIEFSLIGPIERDQGNYLVWMANYLGMKGSEYSLNGYSVEARGEMAYDLRQVFWSLFHEGNGHGVMRDFGQMDLYAIASEKDRSIDIQLTKRTSINWPKCRATLGRLKSFILTPIRSVKMRRFWR